VTEARGDAAIVEVRIYCDQTNPPVGQLSRLTDPAAQGESTTEPIEFSGWLGLLRALYDTLDDTDGDQRKSGIA